MNDFVFHNPVTACCGNHALEKLESLAAGKRVLVVSGTGSAKKNGNLDTLLSTLTSAGATVSHYEGIPQCTYEAIALGVERARDCDASLVIGLGGASAVSYTHLPTSVSSQLLRCRCSTPASSAATASAQARLTLSPSDSLKQLKHASKKLKVARCSTPPICVRLSHPKKPTNSPTRSIVTAITTTEKPMLIPVLPSPIPLSLIHI